jgi:hypothetical protein
MPRINIEDQFWLDIVDVVEKMGSRDLAIGNALRWLRFAQEKFRVGEYVSAEDFRDHGFSEALVPMFAVRVGDGFVARGCDKYFAWLLEKKRAGEAGGRVSAQRPRDEQGRLLPSTAKQTPSKTKHSQASHSISPSKKNSTLQKKGCLLETKDPSLVSILDQVTHETQSAWISAYVDQAWITKELLKCIAWCSSKNVHTKNWGLRFTNWLNNANPPTKTVTSNSDELRRRSF